MAVKPAFVEVYPIFKRPKHNVFMLYLIINDQQVKFALEVHRVNDA